MERLWTMLGWLATGAVVYGGLLAGLYLFQRQMLYHPSASVPDVAESGVPDMRPVALAAEDGVNLLAWFRPPSPGRKLLVYFHGNAGHIGHRGHKARSYLDAGHGVLLVSWRGFGGNAGRPTEQGLMRDARAALKFALGTGAAPRDVVLYGESLGSGPAVILAAESAAAGKPLGGVALESPYTSMADLAQHHYFYVPARWLLADRFEAAGRVADIGAPLLVVHGERDRTIPAKFGRALFDLAREPKRAAWLPLAEHNDLYDHGADRAVLNFLNGLTR
ncbi:MAG: alpha/beta hydrolase [Rhodospirillales bacterium]